MTTASEETFLQRRLRIKSDGDALWTGHMAWHPDPAIFKACPGSCGCGAFLVSTETPPYGGVSGVHVICADTGWDTDKCPKAPALQVWVLDPNEEVRLNGPMTASASPPSAQPDLFGGAA